MTFGELCQQTTKECGVGVTYNQVQQILATSWRLMIEELFMEPGHSRIMLSGILQIYMKKRNLTCGIWKGNKQVGTELQPHYVFRMKPSSHLKSVLNGKDDIRSLRIGGVPLYFDKDEIKKGKTVFKDGKILLDEISRKKHMENPSLKKIIEEREKQKFRDRLPED
jgi:hypothetical protein